MVLKFFFFFEFKLCRSIALLIEKLKVVLSFQTGFVFLDFFLIKFEVKKGPEKVVLKRAIKTLRS